MNKILALAIQTVRKAGQTILAYYGKNHVADEKQDGSPLTLVDLMSQDIIIKELMPSGIKIVSEELAEQHIGTATYWLVDPLDGTKDYLAKNDEFTVNIALIRNRYPILGVVYAPALDELYAGIVGQGGWKEINGMKSGIALTPKHSFLRMAVSHFHDNPDAKDFAYDNNISAYVPLGAALKYGRLAAGEIDVYPRLVGTSEWDTAAGQAVLEAAGGQVLDWHTGERLYYDKNNRRNGRFLALRNPYKYNEFKLKEYRRELL